MRLPEIAEKKFCDQNKKKCKNSAQRQQEQRKMIFCLLGFITIQRKINNCTEKKYH
jgi:hypothetical protein